MSEPLNLVVYVADALRTDHVGCYGTRRAGTPTIDAFAEYLDSGRSAAAPITFEKDHIQ